MPSYDQLREQAEQWSLRGWDFSDLEGRWHEQNPPWEYRQLVTDLLVNAASLLDMGTGGGEFLASLSNLPAQVAATESWPPNVPVARERLSPLGVTVEAIENDQLPFPDNHFDLIINRHESFNADEVYRVLAPGGYFLTQQVGGQDNVAINEAIAQHINNEFSDWSLPTATQQLRQAGLRLLRQEEAFPRTEFYDIGALMLYLKAIPWQIPNFSLVNYDNQLRQLDAQIRHTGHFTSLAHRFLILAQKPLK